MSLMWFMIKISYYSQFNDSISYMRVCPWDEALKHGHPRFAPNQALIYSSAGNEVEREMKMWLNDHPFILTSLECKGVSSARVVAGFDFVVVCS